MAVFEQERHVELVPYADESFVITSRMVSAIIPDQLPHLNVFVLTVSNVLDPTQDTLARVANLADLSLIPIGRDPGIAAPGLNGIEYLADSSTNRYDTLETANDAAKAFQDRVNALITDWISFRTNFNAPDPTPAYYTFPTVDPSQKTALINAYAAAKQAGYTQLQTKNAADAALLAAQADYTYKSSLVLGATTLVTNTTLVKNEFTTTVTQYGTQLTAFMALYTAGSTFASANPGGVGIAAFNAALAAANAAIGTATAQQSAMPGYLTDAQTALTNATNYQVARQNDLTTSSTALGTAQGNQITQAQLLTAANATTAAALAAVYVVCPDFDPTSIPYVPG
jgi:hypothetical protein